MQQIIHFPIKGTYYYDADEQLKLGNLNLESNVLLVLEPCNEHDPFAIQIFVKHKTQSPAQKYLLGYVPKVLAKTMTRKLHFDKVENLRITHIAKHGKFIEIDCQLALHEPTLFYLYLLILSTISRQQVLFKRLKHRVLLGLKTRH